jgi:hypothetical protein
MSDDGGDDGGYGGFGGGYGSSLFGTDPYVGQPNYGVCSVLGSDPFSPSALSAYDYATGSLEASISASAAPTSSKISGDLTTYVGITASAVTPTGGAEFDAGLYSDKYGMVGAYVGLGPAMGVPGLTLAGAYGHTQSLAGESIGLSGGLSAGFVGVSKGYSVSPSSGEITGDQWSVGLSAGPRLSASAAYTSTETTEFTSLYLAYIQFLNWVGFPANGNSAVPWY